MNLKSHRPGSKKFKKTRAERDQEYAQLARSKAEKEAEKVERGRQRALAHVAEWFDERLLPQGAYVESCSHEIRISAHKLAELIINNTPSCADQTQAIRNVRQAFHWAIQAIVSSPDKETARDADPAEQPEQHPETEGAEA